MLSYILSYSFVLFAVAVRLLSGTGVLSMMGFTPLEASLLFFGSRMPRKQVLAPMTMLIACDLYLTLVKYQAHITWDQTMIWAWYIVPCLIGGLLKGRSKPLYIVGAALGSAVSFFLISNLGVWAAGYVGYPKTLTGLAAAYVSAIPFFEKGLVSNLAFSTLFFSVPVLITMTRRTLAGRVHEDLAA
ncbi:MAG TPA: DUF6580 family putative transport protein [Bryobacteraceae bacterium]|nr:DUF6580 family putative transport protein [Bryobacteraceae bacterium]